MVPEQLKTVLLCHLTTKAKAKSSTIIYRRPQEYKLLEQRCRRELNDCPRGAHKSTLFKLMMMVMPESLHGLVYWREGSTRLVPGIQFVGKVQNQPAIKVRSSFGVQMLLS